ncbi:MAG: hypothetical protein ACLGIW_22475, partial [Gammaproteobacteria bacterium]
LAGILLTELLLIAGAWSFADFAPTVKAAPVAAAAGLTNTEALGGLIYTRYAYIFQGAGMVLLVAMIGAAAILMRHWGKDTFPQAFGKAPSIPAAVPQAIPTLKMPTARGWSAGQTPVAAPGSALAAVVGGRRLGREGTDAGRAAVAAVRGDADGGGPRAGGHAGAAVVVTAAADEVAQLRLEVGA